MSENRPKHKLSDSPKLHEGLARPRTRKGFDHVWQRIGRIKEKSRGVGQHYTIDVATDPDGS